MREGREGLIESKVNKFTDISLKINEFVHEKAAQNMSPFKQHEQHTPPKVYLSTTTKAKRSLTDWRQLYNKKQNKIVPTHTVYPATADGDRIRCSMTGQCNRRKIHSSAKSKSYCGERSFITRQTKRQKFIEAKRQSMVEFAYAQNIYQNQLLNNETTSIKEKKFYLSKVIDLKRSEYARVGEYLSKVEDPAPSERVVNPTDIYIKRLQSDLGKHKIHEYNRVKIKQSQKINNERFLQSLRILRKRRKTVNCQKGLRFYERL